MNLKSSLVVVTLSISIAVLLGGCASISSAEQNHYHLVESAPRLASADNFRDIAGTGSGYVTADGKHVRQGVVYRSNRLTLTPQDTVTLEKLGIKHIYDLRTPGEISSSPDVTIKGATWQNFDVRGDSVGVPQPFTSPAEGDSVMEASYRAYVSNRTSRTALSGLLKALASNSGPSIIHCSAGQDRTGWASALLLYIAGVPQQEINENYMLTRTYSGKNNAKYIASIRAASGQQVAAAYNEVVGGQLKFLDAAYSQVKVEFGSMHNYLRVGLGLSEATINKLKDKLTD